MLRVQWKLITALLNEATEQPLGVKIREQLRDRPQQLFTEHKCIGWVMKTAKRQHEVMKEVSVPCLPVGLRQQKVEAETVKAQKSRGRTS